MTVLDNDAIFKLGRAIATMRILADELVDRDASRAFALDNEADELDTLLRQDQKRQDEEDAHREAEYQDWLEAQAQFTDRDLIAAGLPVG